MVTRFHNDAELLDSVPEFVSFGALLKAVPVEDGGARLIYFEASNEDLDHQNEVVLQKALKDSAEYYLRHGNVDISHYSLLGPKSGIPNHLEYEIGKPVQVHVDDGKTFVKAELYQGDSPMARNANMVWDSLTKQRPPSRWYPSVGGQVLAKSVRMHPKTGDKFAVIERVRWSNVALDRTPVNKTVPEISTAPVSVFAKSLGGFVLTKALEASYATDAAALSGGGALRAQSLSGTPISYERFRDELSALILNGSVQGVTPGDLIQVAQTRFGFSEDESERRVARFLADLKQRSR